MHVRELEIRYRPTTARVDNRKRLTNPRALAELVVPLLSIECVEVFVIVCLTTKHHLLCLHEVSRGSLDATVVHPREVFRAATVAGAAVIALAHNHPSGDTTPSADDLVLTTRMVAAGDLMGIGVLDQIIVGQGSYYSFVEAGRLCPPTSS